MIRLSACIQHHPKRASTTLPELLSALAEPVEIVHDPDPEGMPHPWRTYRSALERAPDGATHRLILQDDVVPCTGFLRAARAAVEARPDALVAFFVSGAARQAALGMYRASEKGEAWSLIPNLSWCPTVCLCWPTTLIPSLLEYVDAQRWPAAFRADDEIVGRFVRAAKINALASVPSLVEHPDVTPSLIGRRARGGGDWGRIAACFIGDCDASGIDWTRGPG